MKMVNLFKKSPDYMKERNEKQAKEIKKQQIKKWIHSEPIVYDETNNKITEKIYQKISIDGASRLELHSVTVKGGTIYIAEIHGRDNIGMIFVPDSSSDVNG